MKYFESKEEKTDAKDQLEDIATQVALSALDEDVIINQEDLFKVKSFMLDIADRYAKIHDRNLIEGLKTFFNPQFHFLSFSFKSHIYKFIKTMTQGWIYKEELFLFKNLLKSIKKPIEAVVLLRTLAEKRVTGRVQIKIDRNAPSIPVQSAKMTQKGIELDTHDGFYLCKDFSEAVRTIQSKGLVDGYPAGYQGKDTMTPSDSMF